MPPAPLVFNNETGENSEIGGEEISLSVLAFSLFNPPSKRPSASLVLNNETGENSEIRGEKNPLSDFCRMKGISQSTFSYQKLVLKAQKPAGVFVQLGASCDIELTLANGVTMRVPLKHLPEVLKVLNV